VPAPELPRSARRVHAALEEAGLDIEIRVVEDARTAEEAAAVVGCELGAIVKSLVFRDAGSRPLLVLVSGANRADEALLEVTRGDAAFVREVTGFAIGGVAPVGHPAPLRTLVDRDLLRYAEVWCAGGTPNTLFAIEPERLVELAGAEVMAVA
jgi:prolyl-tRNA editing enzyme YbaK/EbsC (Cys-tRNA(Pro) deacylase)